jgi:regulator of replication initiation timing
MNLDGLVTAIDRLARLLNVAEDNAEQWRQKAAQLESENQALRAEAEKQTLRDQLKAEKQTLRDQLNGNREADVDNLADDFIG